MGPREFITNIIHMCIDFMKDHTEPFFGLTLLAAAIAFGVVELVTDFFFVGEDDLDDE